jgi:hypothetical protein
MAPSDTPADIDALVRSIIGEYGFAMTRIDAYYVTFGKGVVAVSYPPTSDDLEPISSSSATRAAAVETLLRHARIEHDAAVAWIDTACSAVERGQLGVACMLLERIVPRSGVIEIVLMLLADSK